MKMFQQTAKVLTYATVALLASVALYTALFVFVGRESRLVTELESDALSGVLEEQEALSLQNLLQDTEAARIDLERRFLTEENVALFLEDIEGMGEVVEVEVEIESVEEREIEENDISRVLDVSVTVTGSWESVFRYLLLLESFPLSLRVDRAGFGLSGNIGERNNWVGAFDIVVDELL